MLSTQKFKDLDLPGYSFAGLYRDTVEPINPGGYGTGWGAAYQELLKRLQERHPNSVVVRVRIKESPGNAHPSYCRIRYQITGDLYVK